MKYSPRSFALKGFSLVELSVVMMIMSIILGAVLSIATTKTKEAKVRETEITMKKVANMLAAYVAENKRIPCPANGTISQNNATFGQEVAGCTVNPGNVPTKTLQMADDYAFDGWGRRLTYYIATPCSVTINFTNFTSSSLCPASNGITINSAANAANPANLPITTAAVFVLVSHGMNGFGAWSHNGGRNRISVASAGAEEVENANGDAIYVQRATSANFDDIVYYSTRPLLVQQAGGLVGMGGNLVPPTNVSPLCAMMASRVSSNAAAITMCGADNPLCSDALWSATNTGVATQISKLCF